MTPWYCFPHSFFALEGIVWNLNNAQVAPFIQATGSNILKASDSKARKSTFLLHSGCFYLEFSFSNSSHNQNLCQREIRVLTKQLLIKKFLIKTPYWVQKNKMTTIGSEKFLRCDWLTSDWQTLGSARACELQVRGYGWWMEDWVCWQRTFEGAAGCLDQMWFMYQVIGLSFWIKFFMLMDKRSPCLRVSEIKVWMMVWSITKLG